MSEMKQLTNATDPETKAALEKCIECLNTRAHEDVEFILVTEPSEDRHALRLTCSGELIMNAIDSLFERLLENDPLRAAVILMALVEKVKVLCGKELEPVLN